MNKRLLYAGLFGGLGLIIFTLFSAIPTPAPETEILATSHDIEPEPEMESGSDPTPPSPKNTATGRRQPCHPRR